MHAGHREPDDDQRDDGDEVASGALGSRVSSATAPGRAGRRRAAGPLMSGTGFVWQATSMRNGGGVGGQHRLDALGRLDRRCRRRACRLERAARVRRRETSVRAAARLQPQVGAVAVEALAARRRAARRRRRTRWKLGCAGAEAVGRDRRCRRSGSGSRSCSARARSVLGNRRLRGGGRLGEAGSRALEQLREAAELVVAQQRPVWSSQGSKAAIVVRQLLDPGPRLDRAARAAAAARRSGGAARPRSRSSVGAELARSIARGSPTRPRTRPAVTLKLVIRSGSSLLARGELVEGVAGGRDQAREVVRALAEQRLGDDRRVAARPAPP